MAKLSPAESIGLSLFALPEGLKTVKDEINLQTHLWAGNPSREVQE